MLRLIVKSGLAGAVFWTESPLLSRIPYKYGRKKHSETPQSAKRVRLTFVSSKDVRPAAIDGSIPATAVDLAATAEEPQI
jgi:hypothetical protein